MLRNNLGANYELVYIYKIKNQYLHNFFLNIKKYLMKSNLSTNIYYEEQRKRN